MEKMILKSFVSYPNLIDEFLSKFNPSLFSAPAQKILSEILELKKQKSLVLEALLSRFPQDFLESDFFIEFLSSQSNPDILNFIPQMLRIVKLKKQEDLANKLLNASKDKILLDVAVLAKENEVKETHIKSLEEWIAFYATKPQSSIYPTKISFLDTCFNGGLELAQLILISGDPEAGKTRLGLQIIENLAQNHKVCFFCFEFTIENYVRSRMKEPKAYFKNLKIIDEGYDINEIANNIKNLYKEGVKFFLIDSQMRITSPQARNMEEEETAKFSTLAKLCHSLGILIILIVQTSKSDRDNPMGSKKGGHEASITIRIEQCKPEKNDILQSQNEFDENARIILIKKNKQTGKHPKEKVFFDKQTLQFKSLEPKKEVIIEYIDKKEIESLSVPKI